MISVFSWQNSVSLCPASFCTARPNLPVTPGVSWHPTSVFQPPIMKRTSFVGVSCSRKLVNPKGNQSWILIGRTDADNEAPILCPLMQRAVSLEQTLMLGKTEGRRKRGPERMRWLDGITDSWTWVWVALAVADEQRSLACCSPWGHKESDATDRMNWTELNWTEWSLKGHHW